MLNDSGGEKKGIKELLCKEIILFGLLVSLLITCILTRWLNPLFIIGHKRKLEEDDMYKVMPEDSSEKLGEELQW